MPPCPAPAACTRAASSWAVLPGQGAEPFRYAAPCSFAGPAQCPCSARAMPVQCPCSARTVPVGKNHSARTSPFKKDDGSFPPNLPHLGCTGTVVVSNGHCTGTVRAPHGHCTGTVRGHAVRNTYFSHLRFVCGDFEKWNIGVFFGGSTKNTPRVRF